MTCEIRKKQITIQKCIIITYLIYAILIITPTYLLATGCYSHCKHTNATIANFYTDTNNIYTNFSVSNLNFNSCSLSTKFNYMTSADNIIVNPTMHIGDIIKIYYDDHTCAYNKINYDSGYIMTLWFGPFYFLICLIAICFILSSYSKKISDIGCNTKINIYVPNITCDNYSDCNQIV